MAPLAVALPLWWPLFLLLRQDPSEATQVPEFELEEIVVTASRLEEDTFDYPGSIDSVDAESIRGLMPRTFPLTFATEPGVMMQKTGFGQVSPYIRGLTGYHTLALVDGIRLNTSVQRSGPNQYWTTVDPLALERAELLRGPASVLYGSDAVAGSANAIYRERQRFEEPFDVDTLLYYRYASAEDSHTERVQSEGNIGPDFGFVLGATQRRLGDFTAGRHEGLQPETGYGEWHADAKLTFKVRENARLVIAYEAARIEDAPRTHSTIDGSHWRGTESGTDLRRNLDQERDLGYARLYVDDVGPGFDHARFTVSYQHQGEVQDRIRSDGRRDFQGFDVRTLGLDGQASAETSIGVLTYGADFYTDGVDSFRTNYNPDGTLAGHAIQGPVADDSRYDLLGFFAQDRVGLSEEVELTAGLRQTFARLDADQVEDPVTSDPYSLSDDWSALVGDLRLLWLASESLHPYAAISQSFRAPNLSDLTRFDSARSGEIETPASDLDPERFLTFELGSKARLDDFEANAAYFYTIVDDLIVRTPTGRTIDGDPEVTKRNAGSGLIHGVELETLYRLDTSWNLFGHFTWLVGRVATYPTSSPEKDDEPIDRMPPTAGTAGARFAPPESRFFVEASVTVADSQDRLSPGDERDTQRIPPGGTPGYTVYTLRGGVEVSRWAELEAAVENVTHRDYRIHGSGQNEPGTNVVLGITLRF
ncbi:MAG: TonB-dependent receptor [Planctomycetota bacterium]